MQKITIDVVRNVLMDMGNDYVSTLTNEELFQASLQDDLGLKDYEIDELIDKLENTCCCFFYKPAVRFLKKTCSLPISLLNLVCNNYALETKLIYA